MKNRYILDETLFDETIMLDNPEQVAAFKRAVEKSENDVKTKGAEPLTDPQLAQKTGIEMLNNSDATEVVVKEEDDEKPPVQSEEGTKMADVQNMFADKKKDVKNMNHKITIRKPSAVIRGMANAGRKTAAAVGAKLKY